MIEKTISLEGVDPLLFYGVNNTKLDRLKKFFPKLKIIGRGNEIKVMGDPEDINNFHLKMTELISHCSQYNQLSDQDVDNILHARQQAKHLSGSLGDDHVILYGNNGRMIRARTANQIKLVEEYTNNDLMFAVGPAGTGKTYTAIALAVRALRNREVKRIILSRPAVEAEERLGFLPGDLKDKLDPYLQPLYDGLNDMIPPRKLQDFMRDGIIQIAPLAYMRGRTLDNAVVILDEAQNATIRQLKMFLTRMGENAKFIVTGDVTQIDLPNKSNSGLLQSSRILKNIKGISFIYFDAQDIVRHPLVKFIVDAYDKEGQSD